MSHNFKESVAPKCPPGHVLRKSYTTKNGTFVPARCIIERGIFPKNMEGVEKVNKEKEAKAVKHLCNKIDCPQSCPKGQILREGYVRGAYVKKNGTKVEEIVVPPDCISDQGEPGKGPKLISIDPEDHILSDHGYKNVDKMSLKDRHSALLKTIRAVTKDYGKRQALIYVIKALTARATLTKKTSPDSSKAFTEDHIWASGLLQEWKEKHGDKDKDKKKGRIILLGPTQHLMAVHGYQNVVAIPVEKRHAILKKIYLDLVKLKGQADAYRNLIVELNARANLGMTKSPESAKIFKRDADWVSELYKDMKDKKGKKTGQVKLKESKGKLSLLKNDYNKKVKINKIKNSNKKLIQKIEKLA